MGVHVAAGPCLYPHCPSSSTSSSSSSSRRKGAVPGPEWTLAWQIDEHRSPFLGAGCRRISRSRSLEPSIAGKRLGPEPPLRRAISASSDGFLIGDSDEEEEEFLRRLRMLAHRFHLPWEEELNESEKKVLDFRSSNREPDLLISCSSSASIPIPPPLDKPELPWPEVPEWLEGDTTVVPASVERNANSVEMPLSLRLIKRRKRQLRRLEEGLRAAGESTRCSVKKAFSSMVFIIRELHCYALQMRHALVPDELQGVLARVQSEMHASFVWLFQQVFSCTPTLMVSVMLLLANFIVYSMDNTAAAAQPPLPAAQSVVAVVDTHHQRKSHRRLDPAAVKTFTVYRRTASIGGGGGGGKARPVAGATDDGQRDGSGPFEIEGVTIIPEEMSTTPATVPDEAVAAVAGREKDDEGLIWERVVEEANQMQALLRGDLLMDSDTVNALVAPVTVQLGEEDTTDYSRTDLEYQQAVAADPENPLLLANFAQFLYVVLGDLDRAESYFKRAARVKPVDADALSQYAMFLWVARNDLEAAEEMFLESIAAEPSNTHYAATYAHFLWSTGGTDTCFPLDA